MSKNRLDEDREFIEKDMERFQEMEKTNLRALEDTMSLGDLKKAKEKHETYAYDHDKHGKIVNMKQNKVLVKNTNGEIIQVDNAKEISNALHEDMEEKGINIKKHIEKKPSVKKESYSDSFVKGLEFE